MTQEEIQAKSDELSATHKCKIMPIVFQVGEDAEQVVGYIKEPPRFVKLRMMDKAATGGMTASSEVLDAYLIKEESNPKIYSEDSDNDMYYIGACMEVDKMVKVAVNTFKKK